MHDRIDPADWVALGELVDDDAAYAQRFEGIFGLDSDGHLTFANPADYDLVRGDDMVSVMGIDAIETGGSPTVVLHHADGTEDRIETQNTLSIDQFTWFQKGSALNEIRANA